MLFSKARRFADPSVSQVVKDASMIVIIFEGGELKVAPQKMATPREGIPRIWFGFDVELLQLVVKTHSVMRPDVIVGSW